MARRFHGKVRGLRFLALPTEREEDLAALERALDDADRGHLIDDADLETYMAARWKERQRDRGGH